MFSFTECISWMTVYLVESVAMVTLNLTTIIVFIRNRNLRKRSTYLMINLAVADMMSGGSAGIYLVHYYGVNYCKLWRWYSSEDWEYYIFSVLRLVFPIASVTSITTISLERFHATSWPLKHRFIKKRNYGLIIALVWVTAGSLSSAHIVLSESKQNSYYYHLRNSFDLLCLLIICVSYSSIVIKVRCGAQPQRHGAASRERKLTMTLLIVTVVSVLLYLPDTIFDLFYTTHTLSKLMYTRFHNGLIVLYFANSLVNPILYTTRMPDFRRVLVALFRRTPQQLNQDGVIPLHDM